MQHKFYHFEQTSRPETLSLWGTGLTRHAEPMPLMSTFNKNTRIFYTLWLKSLARFSNFSICLSAFLSALWSQGCHHSNPSIFKYGQQTCRTRSHNALLEGHVTMDQVQGHEGHGRTNCPHLHTITWRPHEQVRFRSEHGKKEHMTTVWKVEWA